MPKPVGLEIPGIAGVTVVGQETWGERFYRAFRRGRAAIAYTDGVQPTMNSLPQRVSEVAGKTTEGFLTSMFKRDAAPTDDRRRFIVWCTLLALRVGDDEIADLFELREEDLPLAAIDVTKAKEILQRPWGSPPDEVSLKRNYAKMFGWGMDHDPDQHPLAM